MDHHQFEKVQGWFESLSKKMDDLMTKQQFESRFQPLLLGVSNLHERVENYKIQQNEELNLLKKSIQALEDKIKHLSNISC